MDPYQALQQLVPSFLFCLDTSDILSFLEHGYISRRFVLQGRFHTFGHTRIMRTFEETLLDSLLRDCIPKETENPLYSGDAVGGKVYFIEKKLVVLTCPLPVQSSSMACLSRTSFLKVLGLPNSRIMPLLLFCTKDLLSGSP